MGNIISLFAIKEEEERNWSGLPAELVEKVGELLKSDIGDYVRFRSVCTAWRWSTTDLRLHKERHPPQIPWFIKNFDRRDNKLYYLNLFDGKTHSLTIPTQIVDSTKKVGISHEGWLVIEDDVSLDAFMFNPHTRETIHFPPTSTLPHYQQMCKKHISPHYLIGSVATDSAPNSLGCTFLVCFTIPVLTSFQAGDSSWTVLNGDEQFHDVIHFNNMFFAVNHQGILLFHSSLERVTEIRCPKGWTEGCRYWHWVHSSSSNKLMLFRTIVYHSSCQYLFDTDDNLIISRRKRFELFSLKFGDLTNYWGDYWRETMSLQDQIVFIGNCHSVCIPNEFFPSAEKDSIYLAAEKDYIYLAEEIVQLVICHYDAKPAIHSLKDKTFETLESDDHPGLMWLVPCYY